ncbi:MAG: hypothetical protein HPY55_15885 [Firmicutes bacterium]|nr:hypothetical protein [Bacillota bacterium]
MPLHLYFDKAMTNQISEGTMANPDQVTGDGQAGFTHELALYLGNPSTTKRYENVQITAVNDDANVDIKYAPDNAGAPGTYADVLSVGAVSAGGVVKIWRKVTVAPGQVAQNRVNIKHRVTGIELVV